MIGESANCSNINECTDVSICNTDGSQNCEDIIGGFYCHCAQGFSGDSSLNGSADCSNINECSENPDICGENQSCTDYFGGFLCDCNDGFQGETGIDGPATCLNINECLSVMVYVSILQIVVDGFSKFFPKT